MTNEDLLAISGLLDTKLEPIKEAQIMMQADIREMKADICELGARQTRMELLLENNVLPRLKNIETCYTDAYDKYAAGISEIRKVKADVDILKDVVKEHSDKLKLM